MAYYLSNRGYDVFVSNYRGNIYGRRHVNKTIADPKFWDFSIDEQVDFDLPAKIKLLQRVTGHEKIAYVSWSQGAMTMFALQSDQPEYADVIELFIAMAPTVLINNLTSPLHRLLFKVAIPFPNTNAPLAPIGALGRYVFDKICPYTRIQREQCTKGLFLFTGPDDEGFQQERMGTFLHHAPSGSSFKNYVQFAQNFYSVNKFIQSRICSGTVSCSRPSTT